MSQTSSSNFYFFLHLIHILVSGNFRVCIVINLSNKLFFFSQVPHRTYDITPTNEELRNFDISPLDMETPRQQLSLDSSYAETPKQSLMFESSPSPPEDTGKLENNDGPPFHTDEASRDSGFGDMHSQVSHNPEDLLDSFESVLLSNDDGYDIDEEPEEKHYDAPKGLSQLLKGQLLHHHKDTNRHVKSTKNSNKKPRSVKRSLFRTATYHLSSSSASRPHTSLLVLSRTGVRKRPRQESPVLGGKRRKHADNDQDKENQATVKLKVHVIRSNNSLVNNRE